ncbi:hypothetical protein K435DRAFT_426045 [Dendrothele bispora CBS 962.96]|uniref:Mid2 domain-containing protein n=1 Tax=Dendrothele bispora (strain CBS 962.96) TaxID=1314807 RepID=A0A4S8L4K2_DENBC|nr:hypothetical protein K435DRAFT_426045 [Dendrothele bispora CBS 962.96]
MLMNPVSTGSLFLDFGFFFSVSSSDGQSRQSYETTILDCSVTGMIPLTQVFLFNLELFRSDQTTPSNPCKLPTSSPTFPIVTSPSSNMDPDLHSSMLPGPIVPDRSSSRITSSTSSGISTSSTSWQGNYTSVTPTPWTSSGHDKRKTIAAIVGGVASLFMVSFIVGFFILKRRRSKNGWRRIDPFPLSTQESGEGTRRSGECSSEELIDIER